MTKVVAHHDENCVDDGYDDTTHGIGKAVSSLAEFSWGFCEMGVRGGVISLVIRSS